MPEGTKHLRYKEAVQENVQGKIITIQNQVSFAVIESRFEKDTLIHKGSKSRRHDIVALVLPMPNLWENPKPIMAGGGGGELGMKLARHLIIHGTRPGLTPREILSLYSEGKSVGSRIGSKTLEEEYPRFQLIIEIRDTNKRQSSIKKRYKKAATLPSRST